MLCGPDTIEWSVDSLKRTLRPKGDFTINVADITQPNDASSSSSAPEASTSSIKTRGKGGKVDTMDWLREALVALDQSQRLKFMELTTGLAVLTPDKVSARASEREQH